MPGQLAPPRRLVPRASLTTRPERETAKKKDRRSPTRERERARGRNALFGSGIPAFSPILGLANNGTRRAGRRDWQSLALAAAAPQPPPAAPAVLSGPLHIGGGERLLPQSDDAIPELNLDVIGAAVSRDGSTV
ncbi:hypothetical protein HPB52_020674 [Rhipicephalus sanguineus]|uniref:Uncharacterized protein n=1 Tax=Rhipicephalus sanguineus TaxID=34632 RepID=A0A9D4T018_RHISA|nr:hypothetical protein HPB52_020674 [Rhipicephalus sanguineus]